MAEVLETDNWSWEGGYVSEDGDRMFYVGVVRDEQELRAVITAWRCGIVRGEKIGRAAQQSDISEALGLPLALPATKT